MGRGGQEEAQELLVELRALEREELDTWQEVDLPVAAPPLPVTVRTLREIVEQQLHAPQGTGPAACVELMLELESIMESSGKPPRPGRARRLRRAWRRRPGRGCAASGRRAWRGLDGRVGHGGGGPRVSGSGGGDWDGPATDELRSQRAEFPFWVTKYLGLWPWNLRADRQGRRQAGAARFAGLAPAALAGGRGERLGARASLEARLEEVLFAAPGSCGLTVEQLRDVLLSAGGSPEGVCSATPWLESRTQQPQPREALLLPQQTRKRLHRTMRGGALRRSPHLLRSEPRTGLQPAALRGCQMGVPGAVNVSFLVVMQWNFEVSETINYLCPLAGRHQGRLGENLARRATSHLSF